MLFQGAARSEYAFPSASPRLSKTPLDLAAVVIVVMIHEAVFMHANSTVQ